VNLLFVTSRVPYPPLKGDQVVAHNRLKTLGGRHPVTLVTLFARPSDLDGIERLRPYCREIVAIPLPTWRSCTNAAAASASPVPFQVAYYRSSRLARAIASVAATQRFDVVHSFLLRVAPFAQIAAVASVLELIDSMQLKFARDLPRARGPVHAATAVELRRLRRYEPAAARSADAVIVTTEEDAAAIGSGRTFVVPNGVDVDEFMPDRSLAEAATIVFSGNLGYGPNVEAARWFVRECLPRVRASVPDARLVLAGAAPAPAIRQLARAQTVEVTGAVPVMARVINRAAVAVAPMLSGSGIQNKVLEAMACGVPVVATPRAASAIRARPGAEIAIADEPSAFATAVVELLRSPDIARAIGDAGRQYVIAHHSWEAASRDVEAVYGQALAWFRERNAARTATLQV
jgi:sugar transferase (PEP-CTERM/EpsH1 system associated)